MVDDDEDTRELLREVLSEEGYRVNTSGSGEEAMEVGKRESFDVIISDMRLGSNLNGLDVLRAYKAYSRSRRSSSSPRSAPWKPRLKP